MKWEAAAGEGCRPRKDELERERERGRGKRAHRAYGDACTAVEENELVGVVVGKVVHLVVGVVGLVGFCGCVAGDG